MIMKDITIEQYCDGWFRWDHNDEDMGTQGIKDLLTYLGHNVTVEECY